MGTAFVFDYPLNQPKFLTHMSRNSYIQVYVIIVDSPLSNSAGLRDSL